ncbi:Y-family DNA polymerase [Muricoccus radiodurans]|uniref:Y-family DNA polymerase n=1 Tax=Muricoccus radiodurans TaxID=2231721 RepID=UPI003CF26224
MRRRCCRPPRLLPSREPSGTAPPIPQLEREVAGRRYLALHLTRLATEVIRAPGPLLTWHAEGNRRVVAAADPGAEARGVRAGQALADAQALAPGVASHPDDPTAAAARLAALGLWALRITPLVALEEPDGLLLDITGVSDLFGGEAAVLRRAVESLRRLGHASAGVVAGSAPGAMALARCGVLGIVPPGGESAAVARLPLLPLRLDPAVTVGLRRLGLHYVGDVLAQPRAPLVRRFGAGLALVLDEATGAASRPFRSIRPVPDWHATMEFEEPIVTRGAIDAVVARLLAQLCAMLAAAGRGLRRLVLRAHRADGGVQEVVIGTGLPLRDPRHLGRLLETRLENLAPGFGFDRIALLAERTEPLSASQAGLASDAEEARSALTALLDRLVQRLSVWRLRPRASHWPERAAERVGPLERVPPPPGWAARPRPVRLLRRPERLEAIAELPDAPPVRLRWRGTLLPVRASEGPERFEPEWWRDRPDRPVRDYYRVEMADGRRLWVCRAGGPGSSEWFLHGVLA